MNREHDDDVPNPPAAEKDAESDEPKLDALDQKLEALVPENAPTMSRGDAESKLAEADIAATKLEKRNAEDRYEAGEKLNEFVGRKGHLALGYRQLGPCLRARFGRGRDWAYRSIRFARAATRKDIAGMPWTVADLGLDLMTLTGAKSFAELGKKPLPVKDADGKPVHFPAPEELLKLAIKALEREKLAAKQPETPADAKLVERQALHKADEIYEEHLARRPALKEAGLTRYVLNGEAHFKMKHGVPLRGDVFEAVALYIADVRKALKKD